MTAVLLTLDEAAAALDMSRRTLYRYIAGGTIKTVTLRHRNQKQGVTRIPASEIKRLTKQAS